MIFKWSASDLSWNIGTNRVMIETGPFQFQFVTRAVRVIDLITNLDMAAFQTHGGLTGFINRLEVHCIGQLVRFLFIRTSLFSRSDRWRSMCAARNSPSLFELAAETRRLAATRMGLAPVPLRSPAFLPFQSPAAHLRWTSIPLPSKYPHFYYAHHVYWTFSQRWRMLMCVCFWLFCSSEIVSTTVVGVIGEQKQVDDTSKKPSMYIFFFIPLNPEFLRLIWPSPWTLEQIIEKNQF